MQFDTSLVSLLNPKRIDLLNQDDRPLPCWCLHPRNASSYFGDVKKMMMETLQSLIGIQGVEKMVLEYIFCHPHCLRAVLDEYFDWNHFTNLIYHDNFDWSSIASNATIAITCDCGVSNEERLLKYLLFQQKPRICLVESLNHDLEDILPHCFHHNQDESDLNSLLRKRRNELKYESQTIVLIQDHAHEKELLYVVNSRNFAYGLWIVSNHWKDYKKGFYHNLDWVFLLAQKESSPREWYNSKLQNLLPSWMGQERWQELFDKKEGDNGDPLVIIDALRKQVYRTTLPNIVPPFQLDNGDMFKIAQKYQVKRQEYHGRG